MKKVLCLLGMFLMLKTAVLAQGSCNDPCNLIGNKDFLTITPDIYTDEAVPFYNDAVPCWRPSHGSPDFRRRSNYFALGCPLYSNPANCFENAAYMYNTGTAGEGIFQEQSIVSGRKYFLKYQYARFIGPNADPSIHHFYVKFITHSPSWMTNPPGWEYGGAIPTPTTSQTISYLQNITSTSFLTACTSITADANYQAIWLYPLQNTGPGNGTAAILVKDINLYEVYAGDDQTLACGGGTAQLGNNCNIPGITYSWSPSTGLSNPNIANPVCTITNSGSTTITQTYTLTATYCNQVITDQVTVTAGPNNKPVLSGLTQVCPGETVTYTITNYYPGTNNYTWTINGAANYTVSGNTATVTWGTTPGNNGSVGVSASTINPPACNTYTSTLVLIKTPPAVPVISGSMQTCAYPSTTYTITNAQANTTYSWSVTGGTISGSTTGTSVNVAWAGGGGQINIHALSAATGCTTNVSIPVQPCCSQTGSWLTTYSGNYSNASQMIAFNGGSPTVSNKIVSINDVFTVDADINFQSCQLYMGPNARIVVSPGKYLHVYGDNSTIQSCTDMWDGIYVNGTIPNSRVDIDITKVYDAKNVIVASNGPIVNLNGCEFINNYVGLSYSNFNSFSPVTVKRNIFTQSGTLKPPYSGQKSHSGIKLNNVYQVQVGDPTASNLLNQFSNMQFGIHSSNSYYSIVNNKFTGFTSTGGNILSSAGIYSVGSNSNYYPSNNPDPNMASIGDLAVVVPNSPYRKNNFDKNSVGVLLIGHGKTLVYDNDFTDHSEAGIMSLWGQQSKEIKVSENDMDNGPLNGLQCGMTVIETSTSNSARYVIAENTITNTRQGINMVNTYLSKTLNNTLGVIAPLPGSPWSWGVLNRGTNNANLSNNIAMGPGTGNNSIGILSEVTPNVIEKCNITYGTWVGLQNGGASPYGKYTCNQMILNGCGYFNLNGYMGNQYGGAVGSPKSAENTWAACGYNVATYFGGTPVLDTWYTRLSGSGSNYYIDPPGPGGNNYSFSGTSYETPISYDAGPTYPVCSCLPGAQPITLPDPDELSNEERTDVQIRFLESIEATQLGGKPEFATWLEEDALYRDLVNDPKEEEDPDLIQFIADMENEPIGLLEAGRKQNDIHRVTLFRDEVDTSELNDLKSQAEDLLTEQENISPGIDLEEYNKQLNILRLTAMIRAYQNRIDNPGHTVQNNPTQNPFSILYPFTETEMGALAELAELCPYDKGYVVYEARALLKVLTGQDYYNECELFDATTLIRSMEAEAPQPEVKLYPNPAKDVVMLEVLNVDPGEGMLKIMDASGRIVHSQSVLEYPLYINVTPLQSGTYFVQFEAENVTVKYTKLIVTR